MVGQPQPLDQKFPLVKSDGTPTDYFIRWAQQRQSDIADGITADQAEAIVRDLALIVEPWPGSPTYRLATDIDGLGVTNTIGSDIPVAWLDASDPSGYFGFGNDGTFKYGYIGQISGNTRFRLAGDYAYEFDLQPYVGTKKIYHEGNLSFGSGLTYNPGTGVLTASGGGGGAAPVIVQSAVLCNSNSVGTVTLAAAPAAGNMLIAVGARWTVAVATNAGWTRLYDEGSQTDDTSIIFYKVCAAGESAVQQFSSTVSGWEMAVYEVSGAAPSSIMNYGGDSTMPSSALVSINLGVPKANCLGLGMFASQLRAAPTFVIAGATTDATATDASATNGGPRKMQGFHSTAALAVGAWQPTCTYGSAGINGWTAIILAGA